MTFCRSTKIFPKFACALFLLLAACASHRVEEGASLAHAAGWQWEILSAGTFDIAVASSPNLGVHSDSDILMVYLEGDGFAYVRPSQPSVDPTPTDPVALRLALSDPSNGPVTWIARPCQYTLSNHGRNCRNAYWTGSRYAPEVLDSMGDAIDILKRRSGAKHLVLVGYSGGGAVAVLLAARRDDVKSIITVVGNLDLEYWTKRDGLAPLSGSLDPAGVAPSLGALPQIHFTGGQDKIVGTDVVRSFVKHLPAGSPVRLKEIPDYTHACCWARDWRSLIGDMER
jgi:pimeloyl-ACP methyl ester carboxylesterase